MILLFVVLFPIAAALAILNLIALRVLLPLKQKLDRDPQE